MPKRIPLFSEQVRAYEPTPPDRFKTESSLQDYKEIPDRPEVGSCEFEVIHKLIFSNGYLGLLIHISSFDIVVYCLGLPRKSMYYGEDKPEMRRVQNPRSHYPDNVDIIGLPEIFRQHDIYKDYWWLGITTSPHYHTVTESSILKLKETLAKEDNKWRLTNA